MFRIEHMYDAQVASLFHVMIGLDPLGDFQAVSGVGRTVDAFIYPEGGRNGAPHMLFGSARYGQCRLEWGITIRSALYDWIHAVEIGAGYRRQVFITQFSRAMVPLRLYHLWNAWPVRWEAAKLDANSNAVDTEEIELVFEGLGMLTNPLTLLDAFVTGTAGGEVTPIWTEYGELTIPSEGAEERKEFVANVVAQDSKTREPWKYATFGQGTAQDRAREAELVASQEAKARQEWEYVFVSSERKARADREFSFVQTTTPQARKDREFVFISRNP